MKPLKFRTSNKVIGGPEAGQPEYVPLHIQTDGDRCVSYWQLNRRERLSCLFFGRLKLSMLTGRTQPPVLLEIDRREPAK